MFTIPDYLVIGYVCQDIVPLSGEAQATEPRYEFGGTVAYSARTARALGLKVAALTSASPDFALAQALPGIETHCLPSASTTTFENRYHGGARQQVLHAVAARFGPTDVPAPWRRSVIVHLGPLAQEVDPALMDGFPGSFIGVTPQGWLRAWDEQGHVHPCDWDGAQDVLRRADAVVLGIEDVAGDEALIAHWATYATRSVLVVTYGACGAKLYVQGEARHIVAPRIHEVDPTGAGDIFAAAFFVHMRETRDPYKAARFATCLASTSVTRRGLSGVPTAAEVERCQA